MTDKEFITYIGKILLNSGEDCCSICEYCKMDELCDNQKQANAGGGVFNDDICLEGMRLYAEQAERKDN